MENYNECYSRQEFLAGLDCSNWKGMGGDSTKCQSAYIQVGGANIGKGQKRPDAPTGFNFPDQTGKSWASCFDCQQQVQDKSRQQRDQAKKERKIGGRDSTEDLEKRKAQAKKIRCKEDPHSYADCKTILGTVKSEEYQNSSITYPRDKPLRTSCNCAESYSAYDMPHNFSPARCPYCSGHL